MTLAGVVLVTVVVWAISAIRSVRLRAFVYSLPLPMTLALVITPTTVDGAQVIGVVGLNLFFVIVALLHQRFGWHVIPADIAGIAVYVALGSALAGRSVPFLPTLVAVVAAWAVCQLLLRRWPARDEVPAPPSGVPAPLKPLVIFGGAVLTVLLGEALKGMVVTFPYSGVLTAVETRHNLVVFTRHFARNSLALVAFMTGYHWAQDRSEYLALLAAWAAFALTAAVLHGPRWLRTRRRESARPYPGERTDDPAIRLAAESPERQGGAVTGPAPPIP